MAQTQSPVSDTTSKLSEAQFLQLQAERAKVKIAQSLNDAKAALASGVDPRKAIGEHPWIALGSALVAGFAAVAVTVPSKEEAEHRRAERAREAMSPPPGGESNGNRKKSPAREAIGIVILREIIQMIRPLLMAAITTAIKGDTTPPTPAPAAGRTAGAGPDKPV